MDDIIRIQGGGVDVEAIMRDIKASIAAKRGNSGYQATARAVDALDASIAAGDIPHLIDTMHRPDSHRSGILGRAANLVIGKLFLVTRAFLTSPLSAQDRMNQQFAGKIDRSHATLEKIERRIVELSDAIQQLDHATRASVQRNIALIHADTASFHAGRKDFDAAYQHLILALRADPTIPTITQDIVDAYKARSEQNSTTRNA